MCEHEVDSSGIEYMYVCTYTHMHVYVCTQLFMHEYHIYYNIWPGQCRVQSHIELDPNNHVRGIIRAGLICNFTAIVKKTINLYAYVQLS